MQAPPTPRILVKWPASGGGDELPLMLVRQRPFGAVAQEAADGEQVGMLRVERSAEHTVRLLQHRQRLAPLALSAEHLQTHGGGAAWVHSAAARVRVAAAPGSKLAAKLWPGCMGVHGAAARPDAQGCTGWQPGA